MRGIRGTMVVGVMLLWSCRGDGTPIMSDTAQVPQHVGQRVTLRGPLVLSKMPTILGVDVDAGNLADGQMAVATGRLEKTVVTLQEIQDRTRREGAFAHRGPGTFYRLVDKSGKLSRAMLYPSP